MHGKGTFMWSKGDMYEGDWRAGKMHGHGVKKMGNGDVYEGGLGWLEYRTLFMSRVSARTLIPTGTTEVTERPTNQPIYPFSQIVVGPLVLLCLDGTYMNEGDVLAFVFYLYQGTVFVYEGGALLLFFRWRIVVALIDHRVFVVKDVSIVVALLGQNCRLSRFGDTAIFGVYG